MKLRSPLFALLAGLILAVPAGAHTLSVSRVDVVVAEHGEVRMEVDVALRDVALTLPLDANRDERVTWGELQAIAPALERLVASKVGVWNGSAACTSGLEALGTRRYDDGAYATVVLRLHCAATDALRVRYALFFERDPQHRALVTLRHGASIATGIARADARNVVLARGNAASAPFLQFLREGIHHILVGYDHLAFLLSLLLTAALVRNGRAWAPAEGWRASLSRVATIVTAFTLAHSITLSLAALGWVVPAARWVEPAIAASVFVAALNNVWPWTTRRTWLLGFGFGLVHGFGFAGALGESGLPQGARLASLVGFNCGVELGQLAVVAAVLPPLYALRGTRWYPRAALPAVSLAIAGMAGVWMVQRLSI